MRLLSLDQSSRITGYAVFEDGELIESGTFTLTSNDVGKRLVSYRKHIEELIEKYDIDEVAFEDIQLQDQVNNVSTFKVLAEIFGVTHEYLANHSYGYHIVNSNTWKSKLKIKGKKRQEQKQACQDWVYKTYGKNVSSDEADAIAIGASLFVKEKSDFNWD